MTNCKNILQHRANSFPCACPVRKNGEKRQKILSDPEKEGRGSASVGLLTDLAGQLSTIEGVSFTGRQRLQYVQTITIPHDHLPHEHF